MRYESREKLAKRHRVGAISCLGDSNEEILLIILWVQLPGRDDDDDDVWEAAFYFATLYCVSRPKWRHSKISSRDMSNSSMCS